MFRPLEYSEYRNFDNLFADFHFVSHRQQFGDSYDFKIAHDAKFNDQHVFAKFGFGGFDCQHHLHAADFGRKTFSMFFLRRHRLQTFAIHAIRRRFGQRPNFIGNRVRTVLRHLSSVAVQGLANKTSNISHDFVGLDFGICDQPPADTVEIQKSTTIPQFTASTPWGAQGLMLSLRRHEAALLSAWFFLLFCLFLPLSSFFLSLKSFRCLSQYFENSQHINSITNV